MPKPAQIFPESVTKRWLPDHAEIWRYVPLRTLFFYLNGLVFIPSVAKLRDGDPFEGEFYENNGKTYADKKFRPQDWNWSIEYDKDGSVKKLSATHKEVERFKYIKK